MAKREIPSWAERAFRIGGYQSFRWLLREEHGIEVYATAIADWARRGELFGVYVPARKLEGVRDYLTTRAACEQFVTRVRAAARRRGREAFASRAKAGGASDA